MSKQLVNDYFNEIDRLRKFSGTNTEGVVSEAFKDLLKAWSRQKNLVFIAQYEFASTQKNRIRPDGTILHDLRVPLGYWEAKDEDDDLDVEIDKKLRKGYPQDNILFEDSREAVLIQNRQPVMRCRMTDGDELLRLLNLFFGYERQEIAEFRQAVAQFQTDLPAVLEALREKIDAAYEGNDAFGQTAATFLEHAKETINPTLTEADVREMLIQHILTEEIFTHVFNEGDFHRENNIAKQLYALEGKFFTGATKRETLKGLEAYYATIRSTAALITNHSEKQAFLKVIYEGFYKVYNPKAADRLGVVYTPNEIVKFMIEGADWLTQKHFGKALIDRDVEILDPATGTGTFICELLEHFRGQPEKLAHKYKEELHANEVAILPYYVANLNIEATYAAITGQYAEFPSLCFVDTLDNVSGLGIRSGHQHDLFAGISEENIERVKRQNRKKISVVIGNPPYNAWQENYNSRNPNRPYRDIDDRIGQTYVRLSTAQNSASVYDMYTRFFRWSSDRLHDDGVLALVTNRNFIEKAAYDGFRRAVANEFSEIHVVDLGGDIRANPKLSGSKHNVFGIQTGVAISFLVKRKRSVDCKIFYARRPEFDTAEDKLSFLANSKASTLSFERVEPSAAADWVDQAVNGWDDFLPTTDKAGKSDPRKARSVFSLVSNGVQTKKDEWVYGMDADATRAKGSWLAAALRTAYDDVAKERDIKWDRELERRFRAGSLQHLEANNIQRASYRPFVSRFLVYDPQLVSVSFQTNAILPYGQSERLDLPVIAFHGMRASQPFATLVTNAPFDICLLKTGNGSSFGLPRYRYIADGERIDNITNWAENKFIARYGKSVTKDHIFAYVYAVLHDPVYREKYAINLKREFPRIPFYPDFRQWVEWGQRLLDLHIGYESVEPWPLKRVDTPDEKARAAGLQPKAMLKADKDNGAIRLDSETLLSGLPQEAWDYRLGNRSGVEWVLDQYKEKTPKDPTIREKFNTYRFADYKEKVVDLIGRVTRVSVETMAITEAMKKAKRDDT
jgi:predicted helicase